MSKKQESINPRLAWNNEAKNYTPWLADNIGLLGSAVGIDLKDPQREQAVGRFRADIIVSGTATGRKVLIEAQLEKSDHDHLGKCITYAAWHGIDTVIWVTSMFTEEHLRAVKTINALKFLNLYAVVFKFQQSGVVYSPRFDVVCYPTGINATTNEWTKHAAIARFHMNALAQEALIVEPRLQPIIDESLLVENKIGYSRILTYYALKHPAEKLVGWHGHPSIKTDAYYDAILSTIDDLLPPDDGDLYLEWEDMPEEKQRAWEEWEEQREKGKK